MGLLDKALMLSAARRASCPGHEVFEVLYYLRQRVTSVRAGRGVVAVVYREAPATGSLKNRLYSGISGLQNVPPAVQAELKKGVPENMAGVSVATFMKPIKHLCRHGFNVWDIDVANAFFSMLVEFILPNHSVPVPRIISDYVQRRDEFLQVLVKLCGEKFNSTFSRDDVKELLCCIGFGGTFDGWCRTRELVAVDAEDDEPRVKVDLIYQFEDAMGFIKKKLLAAHPQELRMLQDRKNPQGTLLFLIYSNEERRVLKLMRDAVASAGRWVSMEHDGIVAEGDRDALLAAVQAAVSPLRVVVKAAPGGPWDALKERFPEYDWHLKTPILLKDYLFVTSNCREYVVLENRSKEDGGKTAGIVRSNNQTLAKYVAMQLRPVVNVPTAEGDKRSGFEMFCGEGLWHVKHRDDLTAITLNELSRLMKPSFSIRYMPKDPPKPLNDGKFAAGLGDQILGILAEQPPLGPLDGDTTRFKLLFKDCQVYDFKNRELRRAAPQDRMAHRMGCSFVLWEPPAEVKAEADTFAESVEAFLKTKAGSLDKNSEGKKVLESMKVMAKKCDLLSVLFKFAGSWDAILWFLRCVARMASGEPRICEFLYLYGPGSSGKDVVMLIILSFFGEQPDSYGTVLNGSFIVDNPRGGSSKEGPSPFLAATAGKRFIWVSEVPSHVNLQVDMIKQYCEQSGAPITCRKLFKSPVSFRPMGMIMATSNFAPVIKDKDDDGFERRARVWQTTQTFKAVPKSLTEHKSDPTLKSRILKGEFNTQLLWFVVKLFDTLHPDLNPDTELQPRPEFMKELQDDMSAGGMRSKLKVLLDGCTPVARAEGWEMKDFKKAAAVAMGLTVPQIGPLLTAVGVNTSGTPNSKGVRVVVYAHPSWTEEPIPSLKKKELSLVLQALWFHVAFWGVESLRDWGILRAPNCQLALSGLRCRLSSCTFGSLGPEQPL